MDDSNMAEDDLDIYDDLLEFQQTEEKKSKELEEWENKYKEVQKENDALRLENKRLGKKIKTIEVNFQNLLDTAKAEVKRLEKTIAALRKEKDDICFRRKRPKLGDLDNNQSMSFTYPLSQKDRTGEISSSDVCHAVPPDKHTSTTTTNNDTKYAHHHAASYTKNESENTEKHISRTKDEKNDAYLSDQRNEVSAENFEKTSDYKRGNEKSRWRDYSPPQREHYRTRKNNDSRIVKFDISRDRHDRYDRENRDRHVGARSRADDGSRSHYGRYTKDERDWYGGAARNKAHRDGDAFTALTFEDSKMREISRSKIVEGDNHKEYEHHHVRNERDKREDRNRRDGSGSNRGRSYEDSLHPDVRTVRRCAESHGGFEGHSTDDRHHHRNECKDSPRESEHENIKSTIQKMPTAVVSLETPNIIKEETITEASLMGVEMGHHSNKDNENIINLYPTTQDRPVKIEDETEIKIAANITKEEVSEGQYIKPESLCSTEKESTSEDEEDTTIPNLNKEVASKEANPMRPTTDVNSNVTAANTAPLSTPQRSAVFHELFGETPSNADEFSPNVLKNVSEILESNSSLEWTPQTDYSPLEHTTESGNLIKCQLEVESVDNYFTPNVPISIGNINDDVVDAVSHIPGLDLVIKEQLLVSKQDRGCCVNDAIPNKAEDKTVDLMESSEGDVIAGGEVGNADNISDALKEAFCQTLIEPVDTLPNEEASKELCQPTTNKIINQLSDNYQSIIDGSSLEGKNKTKQNEYSSKELCEHNITSESSNTHVEGCEVIKDGNAEAENTDTLHKELPQQSHITSETFKSINEDDDVVISDDIAEQESAIKEQIDFMENGIDGESLQKEILVSKQIEENPCTDDDIFKCTSTDCELKVKEKEESKAKGSNFQGNGEKQNEVAPVNVALQDSHQFKHDLCSSETLDKSQIEIIQDIRLADVHPMQDNSSTSTNQSQQQEQRKSTIKRKNIADGDEDKDPVTSNVADMEECKLLTMPNISNDAIELALSALHDPMPLSPKKRYSKLAQAQIKIKAQDQQPESNQTDPLNDNDSIIATSSSTTTTTTTTEVKEEHVKDLLDILYDSTASSKFIVKTIDEDGTMRKSIDIIMDPRGEKFNAEMLETETLRQNKIQIIKNKLPKQKLPHNTIINPKLKKYKIPKLKKTKHNLTVSTNVSNKQITQDECLNSKQLDQKQPTKDENKSLKVILQAQAGCENEVHRVTPLTDPKKRKCNQKSAQNILEKTEPKKIKPSDDNDDVTELNVSRLIDVKLDRNSFAEKDVINKESTKISIIPEQSSGSSESEPATSNVDIKQENLLQCETVIKQDIPTETNNDSQHDKTLEISELPAPKRLKVESSNESQQHVSHVEMKTNELHTNDTQSSSSSQLPLSNTQNTTTLDDSFCVAPISSLTGNVSISESNVSSVANDSTSNCSSLNVSSGSGSVVTKRISLGSSDYRFEKTENNVIKLYVTRRKRIRRVPNETTVTPSTFVTPSTSESPSNSQTPSSSAISSSSVSSSTYKTLSTSGTPSTSATRSCDIPSSSETPSSYVTPSSTTTSTFETSSTTENPSKSTTPDTYDTSSSSTIPSVPIVPSTSMTNPSPPESPSKSATSSTYETPSQSMTVSSSTSTLATMVESLNLSLLSSSSSSP